MIVLGNTAFLFQSVPCAAKIPSVQLVAIVLVFLTIRSPTVSSEFHTQTDQGQLRLLEPHEAPPRPYPAVTAPSSYPASTPANSLRPSLGLVGFHQPPGSPGTFAKCSRGASKGARPRRRTPQRYSCPRWGPPGPAGRTDLAADGLAVVRMSTPPSLSRYRPQIPLPGFLDVFHVPQCAAVGLHHRAGQLGCQIRDFRHTMKTSLRPAARKLNRSGSWPAPTAGEGTGLDS